MGNTTPTFQGDHSGIMVPVPRDDFDDDPNTIWVCHAASGSAQRGRSDVCQGAAELSPTNARDLFFSSTTKAQVKGSTPMSHSMFHKQPPQVDTILTSSQALNGAWMDLRLGRQDQLSSRSRVEHYHPEQQAIETRPRGGCSKPMRPRLNAFCRTSP